MAQAYDRIIATITTASDASQVAKAMVKSTEWREGTSGTWLSTSCTLKAGKVYQFRTPLSGMDSGTTAILPNIKASVTVAWDTTATAISTVGDYFMYCYAYDCTSLTSLSVPDTSGLTSVGNYFMNYYAYDCTSLTSLMLPSATGWFSDNNISWSVPSSRLGYLYGYAPNTTSQTAWQALTVSGKTLYTNYIQSEDDVEVTATGQNLTLTCAAGSYSLTGTNADLTVTRHYTLICEAGSYSLTGTNADFYRALVMACEAGSYAITGTDASLTSHRIFALGMGSYVLVGTACGLFILTPTPACRTATIEFENRTFAIPHENRTATIEFENRTFAIPRENRTAAIEYENRTLEVKC